MGVKVTYSSTSDIPPQVLSDLTDTLRKSRKLPDIALVKLGGYK
jgi:hypothetical protein